MENIDANALAEAQRNGSTIMYFAGVAQRWPNNTQTAANTRRPVPGGVRGIDAPNVNVPQPVPQNNGIVEAAPTPAPPRAPARRNNTRQQGNEGDRVRVATL